MLRIVRFSVLLATATMLTLGTISAAFANDITKLVELAVAVKSTENQSSFPPTLDELPAGTTCAKATPCFAAILKTPVISEKWQKVGPLQYSYQPSWGDKETYSYNPQTGKLQCLSCEPWTSRGVAGAIQSGINVVYAESIANGSATWPATLDDVVDGTTCSFDTPCFGQVVEPVTSDKWKKIDSTTYVFSDDGTEYKYVYDATTGKFTFSANTGE